MEQQSREHRLFLLCKRLLAGLYIVTLALLALSWIAFSFEITFLYRAFSLSIILCMFGILPMMCLIGMGISLWLAVRRDLHRAWLAAVGYLPLFLGSTFVMLSFWQMAGQS